MFRPRHENVLALNGDRRLVRILQRHVDAHGIDRIADLVPLIVQALPSPEFGQVAGGTRPPLDHDLAAQGSLIGRHVLGIRDHRRIITIQGNVRHIAGRTALDAYALHDHEREILRTLGNVQAPDLDRVRARHSIRDDDIFNVVEAVAIVARTGFGNLHGMDAIIGKQIADIAVSARREHHEIKIVHQLNAVARRAGVIRPSQRDLQTALSRADLNLVAVPIAGPQRTRLILVEADQRIRRMNPHAIHGPDHVQQAPSLVHHRKIARPLGVLVNEGIEHAGAIDHHRLHHGRARRFRIGVGVPLVDQGRAARRERRRHRGAVEERKICAGIHIAVSVVADVRVLPEVVKNCLVGLNGQDIRSGRDNIRLDALVGGSHRASRTEFGNLPVCIRSFAGIDSILRIRARRDINIQQIVCETRLFDGSNRDDVLRVAGLADRAGRPPHAVPVAIPVVARGEEHDVLLLPGKSGIRIPDQRIPRRARRPVFIYRVAPAVVRNPGALGIGKPGLLLEREADEVLQHHDLRLRSHSGKPIGRVRADSGTGRLHHRGGKRAVAENRTGNVRTMPVRVPRKPFRVPIGPYLIIGNPGIEIGRGRQ